jgi:hypothetical protein
MPPLLQEQFNLAKHAELSKFLPQLNTLVDWEAFRPAFETATIADHSRGGRPNIDVILMFKALILKTLYNLSYEQTTFLIIDRISFRDFLGINLLSIIPDAFECSVFPPVLKSDE